MVWGRIHAFRTHFIKYSLSQNVDKVSRNDDKLSRNYDNLPWPKPFCPDIMIKCPEIMIKPSRHPLYHWAFGISIDCVSVDTAIETPFTSSKPWCRILCFSAHFFMRIEYVTVFLYSLALPDCSIFGDEPDIKVRLFLCKAHWVSAVRSSKTHNKIN